MTTKEQISALESQQLELHAIMRRTDAHALKCAKEGLVYKDTYPDEYTEYIAANKQYNENEEAIKTLQEELESERQKEPSEQSNAI